MDKTRGSGRRMLSGVLVLLLIVSMVPFLPGMTGAQVEAAESNSVYVEVKAMYSYAYEVLNRVNTIRREAGLPTLVLDVELTEAAMLRAAENIVMKATAGSISHTRPNGDSFDTVSSRTWGENLAAGQQSPEEVVTAWMESKAGHREAILGNGYTCIGIGCVMVDDSYDFYWAQEFGYDTPKTGSRKNDGNRTIAVSMKKSLYEKAQNATAYSGIIRFFRWKKDSTGWWGQTPNGYAKDQWMPDAGKWYYFDTRGYMVTGWKQIGKKWYYFNSNGSMKTGWLKSGGKWYYLLNSGIMVTGWKKVGKAWYYFMGGGIMKTGWLKTGGYWYYFGNDGIMTTGTRKIDGTTYRFSADGICLNP